MVHSIIVEQFLGAGANGELFAAPVTLPAFVDGGINKLVRNAEGEEVTSETTVLSYLVNAPIFTTDTRVTLPDGTVSRVVRAIARDPGPLRLPGHVEVNLI